MTERIEHKELVDWVDTISRWNTFFIAENVFLKSVT